LKNQSHHPKRSPKLNPPALKWKRNPPNPNEVRAKWQKSNIDPYEMDNAINNPEYTTLIVYLK
jgi:hypothetical protein